MANLCDASRGHLEAALDADDPAEKNFHIRQALQICNEERIPEKTEDGQSSSFDKPPK